MDFAARRRERKVTQMSKKKEENKEGKWLRSEYRMRSFKRNFTVNEKVDVTKVAAKYADGILVVALPKKETVESSTLEIAVN